MVRRAIETGAANGQEQRGLGPRGRGIFDRLFGSRRASPAPASHQEACTVAIASGKGGTGKSFLATSLAVVAHGLGHRVTLVDCDFGLGSDHLLLGVKPERTLQQVLAGTATIEDVCLTTPAGPSLVPCGSGVRQMADLNDRELQVLAGEFGRLARRQDLLILDVGAGIGPQAVLTMLCADHVILVTQPEIAALTDAYAVIKALYKLDPQRPFSVVVNRVLSAGDGERAFSKLAEVAVRHAGARPEFLGEVLEDPLVSQRRLGQQPLVVTHPDGATALSVRAIAARLAEIAGPLMPRMVAAETGLEERFKQHRLFL